MSNLLNSMSLLRRYLVYAACLVCFAGALSYRSITSGVAILAIITFSGRMRETDARSPDGHNSKMNEVINDSTNTQPRSSFWPNVLGHSDDARGSILAYRVFTVVFGRLLLSVFVGVFVHKSANVDFFCEFFYAIMIFWDAAQGARDETQTARNNAKRARDEANKYEDAANSALKESAAARVDTLEAKRHASRQKRKINSMKRAERLLQEELSANAAAATQAASHLDVANALVRRLEGDADALKEYSLNDLRKIVEERERAQNRARDALHAAELRAAADERLAESYLCCICQDVRKDMALNCGHILCRHCAANVTNCPECRSTITTRKRVYL